MVTDLIVNPPFSEIQGPVTKKHVNFVCSVFMCYYLLRRLAHCTSKFALPIKNQNTLHHRLFWNPSLVEFTKSCASSLFYFSVNFCFHKFVLWVFFPNKDIIFYLKFVLWFYDWKMIWLFPGLRFTIFEPGLAACWSQSDGQTLPQHGDKSAARHRAVQILPHPAG